jgi:hypothetical protein
MHRTITDAVELSIVTPLDNEAEVFAELIRRLQAVPRTPG